MEGVGRKIIMARETSFQIAVKFVPKKLEEDVATFEQIDKLHQSPNYSTKL